MVGGRAPKVTNEVLYRFEFPEAPGALSRFLAALSGGWNVSLFHYRNHGSDFGRVLAGFQVRLPSQRVRLTWGCCTLNSSSTERARLQFVLNRKKSGYKNFSLNFLSL